MELTIKIQAPELAHAMETLAIAIGCTVDKMNVGEAVKETVQQSTTATTNTQMIEKETKQPEESKFTLEEVRKSLGDLSKSKGKEVAKGILGQFNVSKVTELDESQYNSIMEVIKEAK
nr:MAG TPA: hypothetical protein [Caudoviricetes sp.]